MNAVDNTIGQVYNEIVLSRRRGNGMLVKYSVGTEEILHYLQGIGLGIVAEGTE